MEDLQVHPEETHVVDLRLHLHLSDRWLCSWCVPQLTVTTASSSKRITGPATWPSG
jgi:hypothetical protein